MDSAQHAKEHQVLGYTQQIHRIVTAMSGALSVDAADGNVTVAAGSDPFSVIVVTGNAASLPATILISIADAVASRCPANMSVINLSDAPVLIYYTSNPSAGVIFASGMTGQIINAVALTTFYKMDDRVIVVDQGVGVQDTTGTGSYIQAADVSVPAKLMGLNSSLRITTTWKFTGAAGSRLIQAKIGGSGGTAIMGVTNASSVLSHTQQFIIHNKNSLSGQVGYAGNAAAGIGASNVTEITAAINTEVNFSIYLAASLTASDKFWLQHYIVELLP